MTLYLLPLGLPAVKLISPYGGVAHVAVVETQRVCAAGIFGIQKLHILAGGDIVRADVVVVSQRRRTRLPVAGSLALPALPTGDHWMVTAEADWSAMKKLAQKRSSEAQMRCIIGFSWKGFSPIRSR